MTVSRIVPNLLVPEPQAGRGFYGDFLGLEAAMDLGWVLTFCSPQQPAAQLSLMTGDASAHEPAAVSVGISEVDTLYAEARRRGYEIVHPITDEPWGVRRFFVRDPYGTVINLVQHAD